MAPHATPNATIEATMPNVQSRSHSTMPTGRAMSASATPRWTFSGGASGPVSTGDAVGRAPYDSALGGCGASAGCCGSVTRPPYAC